MDWKGLGKKIAGLGLPLLGTALGGPAGGTLGAILAKALGCDSNPASLSDALDKTPDAIAALTEIQNKHEEHIAIIAFKNAQLETEEALVSIREVNTTMRIEATSEHWLQWSWRPVWGYISALAFLITTSFVCYLMYTAISLHDATAIGMIAPSITSFTTLFAVPGAILGITAYGRNRFKEQAQINLPAISSFISQKKIPGGK